MKFYKALAAGLCGSIALTITHQFLHRYLEDAPRMDLMGEEGLMKLADKADMEIPSGNIFGITMAGDLAGNALYYSLAAAGNRKNAVIRGAALGLAAGLGGISLPKHLGLNEAYSSRTKSTSLMTIGIYLLGGIVAGCISRKI
jgi:hypothetical protein